MGLSLRWPGGEDSGAITTATSRDAIAPLLRQCLSGTLAKYPPGYIATLVEADHVPAVFRDDVCDHILEHPELASVTKEEFLEAIAKIRPDVEHILRSPRGDAWIDHVLREIPLGLPGRLLGNVGKIFGR